MNDIKRITHYFARITDDVADALRRIKTLEKRLSSEDSEVGAQEPQMPFLPCKYIFFPVEITSVSTISTLAYGKILDPDFSVDTDFAEPIEITVTPAGMRPAVGDVVRADFIGTIATTITTITSTGPLLEQIPSQAIYSVLNGPNDTWIELSESLDSGGAADGKICRWTTDAATYTVATTPDATVRDVMWQCWGIVGERLLCRRFSSTSETIWIPHSHGAPSHVGTLASTLSAGSSANVNVTVKGNSQTVTAYDEFLVTGDALPTNAKVRISYDVEDSQWKTTNAVCN